MNSTVNIEKLLNDLNSLYDKEEVLKKKIKSISEEYKQLQDDKEMLQTLIMFLSNKLSRIKK